VTRLYAWCENPIPAKARRDAVCCSVRCRQARHRFLLAVGCAEQVIRSPLRLAYAYPPYPGKGRRRGGLRVVEGPGRRVVPGRERHLLPVA
jgi:hypothetical protein